MHARREEQEEPALRAHRASEAKKRPYAKGDARRNARLALEALGNKTHRRMLARLRKHGAMSVSHLAKPFCIALPEALRHVRILESAGLITTEKRGRVRYCIYNPALARELSEWFRGRAPFDLD